MKTSFLVLLIAILSLSYGSATYGSPETIYSKYSPNIVFIESKFGTGTGFLISENLIITNRHVIFGSDEKTGAWNAPKKIYLRNSNVLDKYEHVSCSLRVDLCVIKIPKINQRLNKIQLTDRKVRAGEEVIIIGHPNGIGLPIISKGLASSELARMPGKNVHEKQIEYLGFMTNAAISPGSSGSPVISSNGDVLGVAVGIYPDSQNLNVVISSLELSNFISEILKNDTKNTLSLKFGYDSEIEEFFRKENLKKNKIAEREKRKTFKPEPSGLPVEKLSNESQDSGEMKLAPGEAHNIIRRILLDHLSNFRFCYQKELEKNDFSISGVIKLNFTIGASGHVVGAGIDGESGLPVDVKSCVIGVLKGIAFPEPDGGGTIEVKQPMNFYPKAVE